MELCPHNNNNQTINRNDRGSKTSVPPLEEVSAEEDEVVTKTEEKTLHTTLEVLDGETLHLDQIEIFDHNTWKDQNL